MAASERTHAPPNPNIEIISCDNLNEAVCHATNMDHPSTLEDQFECDESLSQVRVSRISYESGKELDLIQIDTHAVLINQWRADHIRLAAWILEEEMDAA